MKRLLILIPLLFSGSAILAEGRAVTKIRGNPGCSLKGTKIVNCNDQNLEIDCNTDMSELQYMCSKNNVAGDFVKINEAHKLLIPVKDKNKPVFFKNLGKINERTGIELTIPDEGNMFMYKIEGTKRTLYLLVRTEKIGDTYLIKFYRTYAKPTEKTMWEELATTTATDLKALREEIEKSEKINKGVSVLPDGTIMLGFFNKHNDNAIALQ